MKYNVNINQKAVVDHGFDLDFNDMAIFDLIKDTANSPRCKQMNFMGSVYYEFRWKYIQQQLPLLRIKTRQGINKRLQKLIDAKIIVGYPNNSAENTAFFTFGENYERLIFSKTGRVNESLQGDNESLQGCKQKFTGGVNESLHYNSNNNNIHKDNSKKGTKKFVPPSIDEVIKYCQERKNSVDPHKWHNHYTSNGWKVGKNPMKDWQAAVRTWENNDYGNSQPTLFQQQNNIAAVSETESLN